MKTPGSIAFHDLVAQHFANLVVFSATQTYFEVWMKAAFLY